MYFELIVLLLSALCATAELNGTCVTPNAEQGACISFYSCHVIYSAVQIGNETAKQFAELSRCGQDGKTPYVCCGTMGYFENGTLDLTPDLLRLLPGENSTLAPLVLNIPDLDKMVILQPPNSTNLPDLSECGIHSVFGKTFRGEPTGIDEFPWTVALEFKRTSDGRNVGVRCGGSLINKRFVLTAAHCVQGGEFELVQVRLGEWNLLSDPDCLLCDPVQIVKVAEKILHRDYNKRTKNNDIALLRLERDIEYTKYIRPICLPPENLSAPAEGKELAVSGWGSTRDGIRKSFLKIKISVPVISTEKCNQTLHNVLPNQLCAGGDGRDACQGNSGGPLVNSFVGTEQGRVQWYQEGVVSHGIRCGLVGYPGIYTRISSYIPWILDTIESK